MMVPLGTKVKQNPFDIRKFFPYYRSVLQLDSLSDPNFDQLFFTPNEVNSGNPILYRGMQYDYDPKTKSFSKLTLGTGHLGANIYPGVMQVLTGAMKYMRSMDYRQHY